MFCIAVGLLDAEKTGKADPSGPLALGSVKSPERTRHARWGLSWLCNYEVVCDSLTLYHDSTRTSC
jgi:hypothetical protein